MRIAALHANHYKHFIFRVIMKNSARNPALKAIFLSDNYFFCSGISSIRMSSYLIDEKSDLGIIFQNNGDTDIYFIHLQSSTLRSDLIKKTIAEEKICVVMLDDIIDGCFFNFSGITWSSTKLTLEQLKTITNYEHIPAIKKISARERYVAQKLHLSDRYFASHFDITVKSAGSYRRNLINKLHLQKRNPAAIYRIQSCIIASNCRRPIH